LLLYDLRIRKVVLYVKEVLTQAVVVGWHLIPVTWTGHTVSPCHIKKVVTLHLSFGNAQILRYNEGAHL